MVYLVAAYSIMFAFIAGYVFWSGARLARLDREITFLKQVQSEHDASAPDSSTHG